jgi:hypothetical protein
VVALGGGADGGLLEVEGAEFLRRDGGRLPGPGAVRVGRWVGRLGVVSLPVVVAGLDLNERVVRRHVARLQEAGWLGRAAGMWGEGSVVWLTERGLGEVGLGGLRAVRASPAPSPTVSAHGVLVGWSAARAQRRGHVWLSTRELALERKRWEVRVRDERGWRGVLPDLAVWLAQDAPPIGLVVEAGFRRSARQRTILEGWRDAIRSGRYSGVRYDCAGEQTARRIATMAEKIGLDRPVFLAVAQAPPGEIAAIEPIPRQADEAVVDPLPAIPPLQKASELPVLPHPELEPPKQRHPRQQSEPPETAPDRERLLGEVLGLDKPKTRRRWRHSARSRWERS